MNNLLETVWKKYPQLLIGFEFKIEHKSGTIIKKLTGIPYKGALSFDLISGAVNPEICTLLTRSIDSLTEVEAQETNLWKEYVISDENCSKDIFMQVKEHLKAIINGDDYFISWQDFFYLLSIGIWIGSPKNTEVIK